MGKAQLLLALVSAAVVVVAGLLVFVPLGLLTAGMFGLFGAYAWRYLTIPEGDR